MARPEARFNVGEGIDIERIHELRESLPFIWWPFGMDRD